MQIGLRSSLKDQPPKISVLHSSRCSDCWLMPPVKESKFSFSNPPYLPLFISESIAPPMPPPVDDNDDS